MNHHISNLFKMESKVVESITSVNCNYSKDFSVYFKCLEIEKNTQLVADYLLMISTIATIWTKTTQKIQSNQ